MLDKVVIIKKEIQRFIANNLGEPTAKTFYDFYYDDTLPIYSDAAINILKNFMGEEKAREELRIIFIRNHAEHAYV